MRIIVHCTIDALYQIACDAAEAYNYVGGKSKIDSSHYEDEQNNRWHFDIEFADVPYTKLETRSEVETWMGNQMKQSLKLYDEHIDKQIPDRHKSKPPRVPIRMQVGEGEPFWDFEKCSSTICDKFDEITEQLTYGALHPDVDCAISVITFDCDNVV